MSLGLPAWTARRAPWLLGALHVPFVVAGPVATIPRHHLGLGAAELLVAVAVAIGALQLRHSLAAARGERPAGAAWTLLAIGLLVYAPLPVYTWDWSIMQWFVVASAAMLLPRPWVVGVAAAPVAGTTLAFGWNLARCPPLPWPSRGR